jgi:hypothetical protein
MKKRMGKTASGRGKKIAIRITKGRNGRLFPEKLLDPVNPAILFMMTIPF